MNTYKLLTHAILTVSCVMAASNAFAQGALVKTVTKNGKKVIELPRLSRGRIQNYVFPRETATKIQRAVAAGIFDAEAAARRDPIAIPEIQAVALEDMSRVMRDKIVSIMPIEKETLLALKKEEQFYSPEIDTARDIRDQILDISILTEEGKANLAFQIISGIKNHYLATALLNELEECDIYNMVLDLTDYFCLDKKFEQAAFDYTLRHPHQMTLNMRRLVQNPLIDQEAKDTIKSFLHQGRIDPADYDSFRQAIATIHRQYTSRIETAKSSKGVQLLVRHLDDLNEQLLAFVNKHGRAPKYNTTDMQERSLTQELDWAFAHKEIMNFSPVSTYWKMLNSNFNKAPQKVLSVEETLEAFKEFVQTTGLYYPRPISEDFVPSEEEILLWDSLLYWRSQDEKAVGATMRQILRQYRRG